MDSNQKKLLLELMKRLPFPIETEIVDVENVFRYAYSRAKKFRKLSDGLDNVSDVHLMGIIILIVEEVINGNVFELDELEKNPFKFNISKN